MGIVFTDLLMGIGLGMVVAVFIILKNNYQIPFKMQRENLEGKDEIKIHLSNDITFLNKASIQKALAQIPNDTHVVIDASQNHFIHHDVIEIIEDFEVSAKIRNIDVKVLELYNDIVEMPFEHYKLSDS